MKYGKSKNIFLKDRFPLVLVTVYPYFMTVRTKRKGQEMIEVKEKEFEVGQILLGVYGYEARYPEFYKIEKIEKGYVTLQSLKKVFKGRSGNYSGDISRGIYAVVFLHEKQKNNGSYLINIDS
jgi:hypothetical protein